MIPKIIHYCWFGGKDLPESAKKCIESWERYFPDYEIRQWNEKNFDVFICKYAEEAYKAGKWAFVSDYARFWILYNYGGIYFDTDVEVIKNFGEIIEKGNFMGCEAPSDQIVSGASKKSGINVAPGLGLGANAGLGLYKEILEEYNHLYFDQSKTVVNYVTDLLKRKGFVGNGKIEYIDSIYIYPPEYFCPMNYFSGEMAITEKTYSIHHYSMTWKTEYQKYLKKIERILKRKFGNRLGWQIYRVYYFFCVRILQRE